MKLTVIHEHYFNQGDEVPSWAREHSYKLDLIIKTLEVIMATLDDVLKDVTDESTAIDSVAALITGLQQQLADALAGTTLPPATQAKIDAIFTQAETNKGKIAAALAANTPATPAPGAGT